MPVTKKKNDYYAKMVMDHAVANAKAMDDSTFCQRVIPYLQGLVNDLVSEKIKNAKFPVNAESSIDTACTTNDAVYINPNGVLVKACDPRWKKFVMLCALIFHEIGHILFTDFADYQRGCQEITAGNLSWPNEPEGRYGQMTSIAFERNDSFRAIFQQMSGNVRNICEDAFIEPCLSNEFHGFFTAALRYARKLNYKKTPTVEEIFKHSGSAVTAFEAVLLETMFGFEPKTGTISTEDENKWKLVQTALKEAEPYTDELQYEADGERRAALVNEVCCCAYYLIFCDIHEQQKQEQQWQNQADDQKNSDNKPQTQNGSGDSLQIDTPFAASGNSSSQQSDDTQQNQQSGNSRSGDVSSDQMSDADLSEMLDSMQKFAKQNMSSVPKGRGNAKLKPDADLKEKEAEKKNKASTQNQQSQSQPDSGLKKIASDTADKLTKGIAKAMAQKDAEQAQTKDEQQEMKFIYDSNVTSNTGLWKYKFIKPSAGSRATYDRDMRIIKPVIDKAVRQVEHVLKHRNPGGYENGFLMGQRFNAGDVYRNDGKTFSRKFEPDEDPDVAFAILIDESGSMASSDPYYAARRMAIGLESFCSQLEVPVMICGHTDVGDCEIYLYRDFEDIRGTDKYRLAAIDHRACNRDGAAITYCCEKLRMRPEKRKVLLVISDGAPTESGFLDENCQKDTIKTIAKYKDVSITGVCVNKDSLEDIKDIYGSHTMNVSDISRLPSEMLRIVRQAVLHR